MSLESLTDQEKRVLNLGTIIADGLNDPKLSKDIKRILKTRKPELQFPELEQEEAIERVRQEAGAAAQKLQDELNRRDAIAALEAETKKITDAGLDPKMIREFMTKNGITNVEVVIELFESRQRLAEPSADIGDGKPAFLRDVTQEDLKNMWNDPSKWRQEQGLKIQREMRGSRTA